jgi:hypothetical protein
MALKSPEAVLRNALISDTDVQALVNGRIYPLRYVGPSPIQFPIIIWRRARVLRELTMAGAPSGLPKLTIELYVYGATYEAARDLADKCRRVLDGFAGTLDNTEVRRSLLMDEADDLVEIDGAENSLYLVRQTYDLLWLEN